MVRQRFISVLLLALLLVGYETTYRGNWIDSEGRYHNVQCPDYKDFHQRVRMPQNCKALVMGVWLERDYYKNLVLQYTEKKQNVEKLEKVNKKLEERIKNLELQLKIKTIVPPCPACSCLPQILTTTLVSSAGCIIWNQLP